MSDVLHNKAEDKLQVTENLQQDSTADIISELSKEGYVHLKENRIDEAIESFKKILSIDENNNYALVGLGDSKRKQNNFDAAIEFYSQCLTVHPGNNYALFGLADCYKALNQFSRAIPIWEQYLEHDEKNITVLTRIADAYRKIREFKKSRQLYLKVLDLEENNAYALIGLGHLHYDFKEYKDALYYWTKMFDVNDGIVDIRVLTSSGNCHCKLKTYSKGIPYFEKALQMDSENFYALFGLADCYRGLNQHSKSITYWKKILEKDPQNKVILTRVGDAYRNIGDYETAVSYYEKAINIEFDIYAVLGLALINKSQGKYAEAANSLSRLISVDPKNPRIYIDLADCYIHTNRKIEALEVLKSFHKTGLRNYTITEMIEKLQQQLQ